MSHRDTPQSEFEKRPARASDGWEQINQFFVSTPTRLAYRNAVQGPVIGSPGGGSSRRLIKNAGTAWP
jgi:hypothetical protein